MSSRPLRPFLTDPGRCGTHALGRPQGVPVFLPMGRLLCPSSAGPRLITVALWLFPLVHEFSCISACSKYTTIRSFTGRHQNHGYPTVDPLKKAGKKDVRFPPRKGILIQSNRGPSVPPAGHRSARWVNDRDPSTRIAREAAEM